MPHPLKKMFLKTFLPHWCKTLETYLSWIIFHGAGGVGASGGCCIGETARLHHQRFVRRGDIHPCALFGFPLGLCTLFSEQQLHASLHLMVRNFFSSWIALKCNRLSRWFNRWTGARLQPLHRFNRCCTKRYTKNTSSPWEAKRDQFIRHRHRQTSPCNACVRYKHNALSRPRQRHVGPKSIKHDPISRIHHVSP